MALSKWLTSLGLVGAFLATSLTLGCAGNRQSSAGSDMSTSSSGYETSSSQRLEDAKRSAEEAEQRAHGLREEKLKQQNKSN